jgi:hypothetical protein
LSSAFHGFNQETDVMGDRRIFTPRGNTITTMSTIPNTWRFGFFNGAGRMGLLFCVFLSVSKVFAQYEAPYKIVNRVEDRHTDSVWVLFPDLQKRSKDLVVAGQGVLTPDILKTGESILLDSAYRLLLQITRVELDTNAQTARVWAILLGRQEARLILDYRRFGSRWIVEGKTGYEPLACDHLTISMYNETMLVLGLSFSANCN